MAKAILDLTRTETGQLPMVCMRCGQPATSTETKVFTKNSFPSFRQAARPVYSVLPFGGGEFLQVTVQGHFCDKHKNYWARCYRAVWMSLAGCVVFGLALVILLPFLAGQHPILNGLMCGGAVVIGLGWLVFLGVMESTTIRPKKMTENTVTLVGVSDDFISAYQGSVSAAGEGLPLQPQEPRPRPSDPVIAFQESLAKITPRPWITFAIVGINVAVFTGMAFSGVNPFDPKIEQLIAWGADFAPMTTSGQWWRLFTSNYLHSGIGHLLFNMWALLSVGMLVERLLGQVGFLIVYVLSGLIGSLASVWWHPITVSVGASGAIFGVYGALGGILVSGRLSIPPQALSKLRYSTLFFVGANLFYGLTDQHINVAAHLGGLVAGFMGGLALSSPLTPEAMAKRPIRNSILGGAAVLLVGIGILVVPKSMAAYWDFMTGFEPMEKKALDFHNSLVDRAKNQKITDAEMANAVEAEILPEWRSTHQQLVALEAQKNLPAQPQQFVTALELYMKTREESWEFMVQALRDHDSHKIELFNQKWTAANEQAKRISSQAPK
jgi:rhomboid protease GluP